MKKYLVIILLVLTTINLKGQEEIKKHETDIFSIEYPENWHLDTTGRMNSSFILFSELKENDVLNENINLLVQDLTNQGFTMESYVKLSINQIKSMVPDGKIIESNFNKEKNHQIVIWSGIVNSRNLKFKQYYFLKNEKAYILTLTTLPETFKEYIKVADQILNSFKLK